MNYRPSCVRINADSLLHNLRLLQSWTRSDFFCPMVKANAYGHGLEVIAKLLIDEAPVQSVGVALVEEGVAFRKLGFDKQILCMSPLTEDSALAAIENRLTPVLGRMEDLRALIWASKKLKTQVEVHLKFNTGMQRVGFDLGEEQRLFAELKKVQEHLLVVGVCTHLSHGQDILVPESFSQRQIKTFLQMAQAFPGVRHVHKSSSLISLKGKQDDSFGSRPGIAVYGLYPDEQLNLGLKPVLSWQTEISHLHAVEAGSRVSYEGTWTAMRRSWIGVLPVGYGDGLSRLASNRGEVLFRGQRVPIVGRVCMDYFMVDLTEAVQGGLPKLGEAVVLIGQQGQSNLGAEDWAKTVGTISYEIVTSLSQRLPREIVRDETRESL